VGCNATTTDTITDTITDATTTDAITDTIITDTITTYAITDATMMLPTPLSVMEENIVKVTILYYAVAVAVVSCASNVYV